MKSPKETSPSVSRRRARAWLLAIAALFVLLLAPAALAELRREGDWSEAAKRVTLSLHGEPRSEAIRKLASKAGWSVVVEHPSSDPIDLAVTDQPADKVLELLVGSERWVATKDGTLIALAPDVAAPAKPAEPTPPTAPTPPAAPEPPTPPGAVAPVPALAASAVARHHGRGRSGRHEDRVITGGSVTIGKDQTVGDVTLLGGSLTVAGRITGDLAVIGGSATIEEGGRVDGDATALGGSLSLENGASVDGDIGILGGALHRAKGAEVGGEVTEGSGKVTLGVGIEDGDEDEKEQGFSLARVADDIGGAITATSLLFVFGAVLLALTTGRMDSIEQEVAARPMRSFALGVVGFIASIALVVALCVTVVGIPLAILLIFGAVIGGYAGVCAVLTTVGAALVGHKTKSAYIHLAVGCVLFMLLRPIPFFGPFVTLAVILVGLGALVATRGAGLWPKNGNRDAGPYRTAAA